MEAALSSSAGTAGGDARRGVPICEPVVNRDHQGPGRMLDTSPSRAKDPFCGYDT